MRRVPAWRRYLRFWRPDIEGDIDDELRLHLESRTEELVARGATPGAARAQAHAEFGDLAGVRRELHAIDERVQGRHQRAEQEGQAVGTVYFGIAVPDAEPEAVHTRLPGDRLRVRQFSTISLLNLARLRLLGRPGTGIL